VRTEEGGGVVGLGGGRRQQQCSVISRRHGEERDEMEWKRISLSSHLRGRYLFLRVVHTIRGQCKAI
jgi:hypothetical protein